MLPPPLQQKFAAINALELHSIRNRGSVCDLWVSVLYTAFLSFECVIHFFIFMLPLIWLSSGWQLASSWYEVLWIWHYTIAHRWPKAEEIVLSLNRLMRRAVKRGCKQVAQLSQRDRAARCVNFGQKWKTGTGTDTICYGNNRSIFDHFNQSYRIRRKKTQNKGYYAVQCHSRLSKSVAIESPYATSY